MPIHWGTLWMGTAARGRIRRSAWAARSGFMWPPPSVGPQPHTGRSAMSMSWMSAIAPKSSVSPAKYTR